ncbi:MAG: helix-turn-helix transcriptional regulator [Synergistetes bacterium]|nr:helix-turn-helix transcriptional regulator [Synergistota bacterium]
MPALGGEVEVRSFSALDFMTIWLYTHAVMDELEKVVSILKAISDKKRLKILLCLKKQGEECVCRIAESLGESQPNVSKHLFILRSAGLVKSRREGTMVFYSLSVPPYIMELLNEISNEVKEGAQVC